MYDYNVDLADCNPTPDGKQYTGKITDPDAKCLVWLLHDDLTDADFADGSRASALNYCRNPNVDDPRIFNNTHHLVCITAKYSYYDKFKYVLKSCGSSIPLCGLYYTCWLLTLLSHGRGAVAVFLQLTVTETNN